MQEALDRTGRFPRHIRLEVPLNRGDYVPLGRADERSPRLPSHVSGPLHEMSETLDVGISRLIRIAIAGCELRLIGDTTSRRQAQQLAAAVEEIRDLRRRLEELEK